MNNFDKEIDKLFWDKIREFYGTTEKQWEERFGNPNKVWSTERFRPTFDLDADK